MRLVFRVHAIQRMFQNSISEKDVRQVLEDGDTIKNYADDTPYPSRLVLGWLESRPVHVVAADDIETADTYVSRSTSRTQKSGSQTSGGRDHEVCGLQAG